MLLEIAKSFSFFLSLLSLYPVMACAFFLPASRWQERLEISLPYVALSACVCFASGYLFSRPSPEAPQRKSLITTLPVRLFFCALAGMVILFAVVCYLEEYYVPLLPHGCCRP
ncbi:MAG: hypothetical protein ACLQLH_10940 [Terracidiphilus sp.]